jgi:hypothetical protein
LPNYDRLRCFLKSLLLSAQNIRTRSLDPKRKFPRVIRCGIALRYATLIKQHNLRAHNYRATLILQDARNGVTRRGLSDAEVQGK